MGINEPILTISVTARLLNIHPRTIMLYERTKLFTPYRTNTQRRMFSDQDLEALQFIRFLTKQKKINLQGVRVVLEAILVAEKAGVNLKSLLFPDFKAEKLF
ncbi:MAG: MerR family transcriptional regulator [Candidatus Daviesbacteria bacterium]|nr:MerR family transcriptional regulator [Candidatus Daviesbacteria bacterium]